MEIKWLKGFPKNILVYTNKRLFLPFLLFCLIFPTIIPIKSFSLTSKLHTVNPCIEFDQINTQVRDGLIDKEEAKKKISELIPKLKEYFYVKGGKDFKQSELVFPLLGYGSKSIGGINGSGYIASGYNYFDGNKHGGHPAHDIFINDRNQDLLDDRTKSPVKVLSMSDGIVVAIATTWETSSDLRGGKYIAIYDPFRNGLFYYAHNNELFVELGKLVKAGDEIATVGRTGKSAYAKRSPTHLHLMYLTLKEGYPKAENIYKELLQAKVIYEKK